MQTSFKYRAVSNLQQLQVRLADELLFNTSKTPPIHVLDNVTVVLSGTSPSIIVEINCQDISEILADNTNKVQFARICGPEIYRFLEVNHFYFNDDSYCELSLEDVKGWQIMWLSIQNDIFGMLGRTAVVLIEGDDSIEPEDAFLPDPTTTSYTGNVKQLFGRK
jgi:hypothetical protein